MGIFTKMIAEGVEILNYIPQRPPIVMVDQLVMSNEEKTETRLNVTRTNIFCKNGLLTEPGIIENIAQSAALRSGYDYKKANKEIPIGFIGAIKNLKIHNFPKTNQELKTEIKLVNEILDFSIIQAKVSCSDKLIAECEMKIFLKKD